MISRQDAAELRKRMTKDDCTITRVCGCYVNADKQVLLRFSEDFRDLEEAVYYKYLEIAKKTLSGTIGNNLLELHFGKHETGTEHQRFLYALKASKLKEEAMLDRFYEQVMESYAASGNYLILVFHDIYDVVEKTKDRKKLDVSSETFEYMICAVCPVEMSKAGLSYSEEAHAFAASARSWMVGMPEIGFTYPAFAGRSADASSVMYYVKTGKDSRRVFMEDGLGCESVRTAGEEKNAFQSVVEEVFEDPREGESVFLRVQKHLSDLTVDQEEGEDQTLLLTKQVMKDVVARVEMPEEARELIQEAFEDEFGDAPPRAENLVDKKLVEQSQQRIRTLELEGQVTDLKQQLQDQEETFSKKMSEAVSEALALEEGASISIHVSPQKARKIHAQLIGGVRHIVVPLEDADSTEINGTRFDG